jgi:hypothetical protein
MGMSASKSHVRTHRSEQPMSALDDISASAEQQEGPGPIRALSFPLIQAFVSHQSPLLIANETTDLDTTEWSGTNFAIYL